MFLHLEKSIVSQEGHRSQMVILYIMPFSILAGVWTKNFLCHFISRVYSLNHGRQDSSGAVMSSYLGLCLTKYVKTFISYVNEEL
jgi:hypothetical protein